MKTLHPTIKDHLGKLATSALIFSAAALVALGLLTQCDPKPVALRESKKGACKKWADDLAAARPKKLKLRKAFVTALKESAKTTPEGIATRQKLLDDKSEVARDEILRLFYADTAEPNFDPNFPKEAWFKFFEPDEPVTKIFVPDEGDKPAQEHCLHIFYLPEVGAQLSGSDEMIFGSYLRCCYQPWLD